MTVHRCRGFSLIEMLISLVILGILFAGALPSYGVWIQSGQIRTAAESLEAGLQLAHSEAVRRNARVSTTLTGNDWSVDTVSPAQNIQSRKGAEGSSNVAISSPQSTITFNGMGRIVPPTNLTFGVINPSGGACQTAGGPMRCLNVSVEVGGAVRLCDPALPSSNPQAC